MLSLGEFYYRVKRGPGVIPNLGWGVPLAR